MVKTLSTTSPSVKVLDPVKDLKPRFEKFIKPLVDLYCVTQDAMIIIARHYKWSKDMIDQRWFDEQEKLQYELGLEPHPAMSKDQLISSSLLSNNPSNICPICYESMESSFSLGCGHTFCKDCWTNQLAEQVQGERNSCESRCMQQGCNMQVGHSNFLEMLKGD